MSGLPRRSALAERLYLPELRGGQRAVPCQPHPDDVQGLRTPEHGDRGHDLRQDAHPAQSLAGRGLVPDQPEARRERSRSLQRVLGLGSYQTAWAMLHRLRRAMVRPDRERLHGTVEVDETYLAITDREEPLTALGRKNNTAKVLVALAVEVLEPRGFGRIRLRRIAEDSQEYVVPFVQASIEPGSRVRTDGSAAYRSLAGLGYGHQRSVMLGAEQPAHATLAGVHRVASLVKRWILGTHHGAVQPEHLDAYLDEFVFRFNRRTSSSRGMLFYRLLQQAVVTNPVTYSDIVVPEKEQSGSA